MKMRTGLEIAVIGMTGRFPGAKDIHEFWDNLKNGKETISFFADEELQVDGVAPQLLENPDYVKSHGVLANIEYFDASFFGYPPKEAEIMDPQMRIFHECVWNALEDAGYAGIYDGLIGIYAGASPNPDWQARVLFSGKDTEIGSFVTHQLIQKDFLSLRISYKLNLMGPSFVLGTACSTSLVAIHVACQAILNGECDIAMAGGITVLKLNKNGYLYQQGMIGSPDGHCRAFDARANGIVGGDGAGIVVLKRLEEAISDRDHIYAVIKGSSINNDGLRKAGFSASSVDGQAEVIKMALQMAEVEPQSISYIETHGTGTQLGDPVEIEGLRLAFNSSKRGTCGIGSVKSNVGHLDSAAGAVGFIKTVLALKHKLIPPSLHFENSNPDINLSNTPFYVISTLTKWENQSGEYPLRAGVSSFGIGGTNAHVILEEAPGATGDVPLSNRQYQLILLSAKTPIALDKMTGNLVEYFNDLINHNNHENPVNPGLTLADASYTLQVGRAALPYKRMAVCSRVSDLKEKLSSGDFLEGKSSPKDGEKQLVFMYPGQGAQYSRMGEELYKTEPVFRREMDRCFQILESLVDYDIKEILYPTSQFNRSYRSNKSYIPQIHQTEIAQLLLFVFEYALTKLLVQWGIKPYAMIGHSIGEYTAACLAGVFSLPDALKVVALRGKLMQQMPSGAMVSVSLGEEALIPLLNRELSLAAINSTSHSVVSGSHEAVNAFDSVLKEKGYKTRMLHTSHAFHSRMMDPILKVFAQEVGQIKLNPPQIPFISNRSGKWIRSEEAVDPGYWAKHLREAVRFADGLSELFKEEDSVFLEVGPGRGLSTFVRQHQDKKGSHPVINLVRHPDDDISDSAYLLKGIGQLWLKETTIHWVGFYGEEERQRISLPTYPFEGQRYWIEAPSFTPGIGMVSQNESLEKKQDLADWFYLPQWRRSLPGPGPGPRTGESYRWLVFLDEYGPGSRLAEQLRQENHEVITVRPGDEFQRKSEHEYVVNPAEPVDYKQLALEFFTPEKREVQVVHLWGVRQEEPEETGFQWFHRGQYWGFNSLVYLVRAITQQDFTGTIQITVISNGLHQVTGGESIYPEKATLLGPVKVIPQEYPYINCRSIDIDIPLRGMDTVDEEKMVRQLLTELENNQSDKVVALRGGHRWVQHFEPVRLEAYLEAHSPLREQGVYLITGGLGGIGRLLAEYLVKRVKAKLVLVGRTLLPGKEQWKQWLENHEEENTISSKLRFIQSLEKMGAEVLLLCADVGNRQQMEEAVTRAEQRFGCIHGVIHAAGLDAVSNVTPLSQSGKAALQKQFAPKIYGPVILAKLLEKKKLDFCLLMSSLAAVLGGLGFTAYSAANLFMDAFVQKVSQTSTTKWISVNWDAWQLDEAGTQNPGTKFEANLMKFSITPQQGLRSILRILSWGGTHQVVLSTAHLETRLARWINLKTLREVETTTFYSRPNLSNPYVEPRDPIQRQIAHIWGKFFGFRELGINDDFFELGGDSLKAMSIVSNIYKELEIDIPLTEFFRLPTIKGIAGYVRDNPGKTAWSTINPIEKKEYYILSSAQKRLYLLQQMQQDSIAYNLQYVLALGGETDAHSFNKTLKQLIRRHESLRTSFVIINEESVQLVHDSVDFEIEYHDLSTPPVEGEKEKEIIEGFVRPFDLSQAPLMRVGLIKKEQHKHIFILDMHHITTDGVSHFLLINEFILLYTGEKSPPLKLDYKDYSAWQQRNKGKDTIMRQEEYWLREFNGEIPVLTIPTDFPRPVFQDFEGSVVTFELNPEHTKILNKIARLEGTTLFTILLAVYYILLSKLSNQEDIVIGTPIAGRRHQDLARIIGMFVNTLALRNRLTGHKTFEIFLREIKGKILEAFENQDYQFEDLVEKAAVQRDMSRNPLFDVMFSFQNASRAPGGERQEWIEDLSIIPYDYERKISQFDLTLNAFEQGEKLFFGLDYCSRLFTRQTILSFARYFKQIVSTVVEKPGSKISKIELITEEEKKRILFDFNDTGARYPGNRTIHELFVRQAERTPDHAALVGEAAPGGMYLSYKELNQKSDQLAFLLTGKGVQPDTIVGIMMERSVEMIVGILGILKAGGAYLSIDPDYPEERIQYMLKDSRAKILLAASDYSNEIKFDKEIIYVSDTLKHVPTPPHPRLSPASATSLAYIIYTSGSTGRPKGVLVNHASIINTLSGLQRRSPFSRSDVYLMKTSYLFDVSVTELFGWFMGVMESGDNGGRLALLQPGDEKDPRQILAAVQQWHVTHINFVPSMFNAFLEYLTPSNIVKLSGLKYIFLAGEALQPGAVNKFRGLGRPVHHIKLENLYGPTEASVYASGYSLADWNGFGAVPIGKPLQNVRLYILDRHHLPQPVGVPGELCIAGAGLAQGYLNRPGLTRGKFDHDLWDYLAHQAKRKEIPGEKIYRSYRSYRSYKSYKSYIYRTGDLARWAADGNIQFLGRFDHQVKVRGFRIEPGEIENQLLKNERIKEALVMERKDNRGENYLCAYVVAGEVDVDRVSDNEEIKKYLSKALPDYMVPSFFVKLDHMPLTPQGKIDRRALPEPGVPVAGEMYTAPGNRLEEKLLEIWSDVLLVAKEVIGIKRNFFELGGQSLRAMNLMAKIHKELNVILPLAEVFKRPTIRALAEYITYSGKTGYKSIEPVEEKEYYQLSSAQKRLYFLQQMDPQSTGYNMSLVFPLGKEIEKEKLESALKQLIARHEALRTSFDIVNGKPVQKIHKTADFSMDYYETKEIEPGEIVGNFVKPFELKRVPLIRAGVIKHRDNHFTWMVDVHHIISDGTSHEILSGDFIALYNGTGLKPLKLQYKDFSGWQNEFFASGGINHQWDYWFDLYKGEIPRLNLPTDFERPPVFTFEGDRHQFMLEKEDASQFRSLASRNGATLFMNMLAALNTLFYKYTHQADIIIGTGIAGRPHADLQGIIGMFVNTLAVRNYPGGEKNYRDFLKEVSTHSIEAFDNQDIQFEDLVDKLEPERDPARNPLFDITMVVQNFQRPGSGLLQRKNPGKPTVSISKEENYPTVQFKNLTSKFDMTFFVYEQGDQVLVDIEYYRAVFKKETVQRLTSHFNNVIKTVNNDPSIKLKDIDITPEEEKRQLLDEFNDTVREYPRHKTIHELFVRQVENFPHHVGVRCLDPGDGEKALTYRELDKKSNQLANYLKVNRQLAQENLVGILMERSIEQVTALLGVLKSGGAYIPIDSSLPQERIKRIIDDARLGIVLSQKKFIRDLNWLQWECATLHTFMCMDTFDIYSEQEAQKSELMDEELWEYVAESAIDEITGGGWFTSYTGEPFTREEMDEYGDNILKKLKPILHPRMRVLEIGCGSGITMQRIASLVGYYYATDLSRGIIERNKKQLPEEEQTNIVLRVLPAHEIDNIEERDFDLVIINSVVQSFHGHNYLGQVIGKAIDMLSQYGYLFIGDILDLDLKPNLIREMLHFKYSDNGTGKTKTDWSADLFVSRMFFEDYCHQRPEISSVKFSTKIYTIENELTKFRYDTFITIDKTGTKKTGELKPRQKYQHDMRILEKSPANALCINVKPGNLAYVIYTSGSTGNPKGVMVEHRNVVRLVKNTNYIDYMEFEAGDRFLLTGAFSFDISTFEIWGLLLNGIDISMVDKGTILDAKQLKEVVVRSRISLMHLIPQLFSQHVTDCPGIFEKLKCLLVGGDMVNPAPVAELRSKYRHLKILHMYGPTENTTFSTFSPVDSDYRDRIPIGKPLSNSTAYILDPYARLKPIGTVGELSVGGEGLARGYLNNPRFTREKFVENPLLPGKKIYLTGDRAKWSPDGNIEFFGRTDYQVKIRGFRIELEEIENLLLKYNDIKEVVAAAREKENGDRYLCAYFTAVKTFTASELHTFLSGHLPDYMVPSHFVQLEKIPLTVNGKIDRRALPEPGKDRSGPGQAYVEPGTELEKKIVGIWKEVLDADEVGVLDNFFEIGGHSLKVIQLKTKVENILNHDISVVRFFEYVTVRSFANYLLELEQKGNSPPGEPEFDRSETIKASRKSRGSLREKRLRRRENVR